MMTGPLWNHAFMGPSTDCSRQRSARWSRVGSRSRDAWCTYWGSRALGEVRPVRRALLAVYDKTGLVALAKELADQGVALVSSGGTARPCATRASRSHPSSR